MLSLLAGAIVGGTQDRVATAYENVLGALKERCRSAQVAYPPKRIYLRAFKREASLEVWGSNGPRRPFRLLHAYPIAALSGALGPKLKEGDRQVPEGFYRIDRFNPQSRFHLSLGLNYPNARDRIVADKAQPGSDIFIHGNEVSIGCLAMTDAKIEEIYVLAVEARKAGQAQIPVHIFPFRMNEPWPQASTGLTAFWKTLAPAFEKFERTHFVPKIRVSNDGRYVVGP